jgi:hypothetical protein
MLIVLLAILISFQQSSGLEVEVKSFGPRRGAPVLLAMR